MKMRVVNEQIELIDLKAEIKKSEEQLAEYIRTGQHLDRNELLRKLKESLKLNKPKEDNGDV